MLVTSGSNLEPEGFMKAVENRKHAVLTATRLTERERALVDMAAKMEGVTVKDLIRGIVLPAVSERVASAAAEIGGGSPRPPAAA